MRKAIEFTIDTLFCVLVIFALGSMEAFADLILYIVGR